MENRAGNPNCKDRRTSKRDDNVKLLRMDIIAPLLKKGYTYREIRTEVMARLELKTYSLGTVKHDVDSLLKEWREQRIEDTDMAVQLELQRIDDLVREAWAGWEKSKMEYDHKKTKATAVPTIGGGGKETRTTKVEQTNESVHSTGDPRFIDTINKLLVERRKLLGLYAPEKKEVATDLSFADFLMKTGQKKTE